MLDRGEEVQQKLAGVLRIHIRDNQFYVSAGQDRSHILNQRHEAFAKRDAMLAQLAYAGCHGDPLPDMDALFFMGDGIQEVFLRSDGNKTPIPQFGFQKRREDPGILVPYSSYWLQDPEDFQIQANKREDADWTKKKDTLFWRGTTTGGIYTLDNWREMQRTKAVLSCLNDPVLRNMCDIKFYRFAAKQTDNATRVEMMKEIGELGEKMPLLDQMQYKFVFAMDGNGPCSGRFEQFAAGTSLIVKPESEHIEFFHSGLRPNVHYLSVKEDLSDLTSQIAWALDHQEEAQQMVRNMQKYSRSIYQAPVSEYLRHLFVEYSKLLRWDVAPLRELQKDRIVRPLYPKPKPNTHNLHGFSHTCSNPIYACDEDAAKGPNIYTLSNSILGTPGQSTAKMCFSPNLAAQQSIERNDTSDSSA